MIAPRKLAATTVVIVVMTYAIVAASPIKGAIARRSPAVASLFSPPLFNFSHTYDGGRVLEFQVGMSRDQLFERLSQVYGGRAELTVNCIVTTANSVVPITPELDIRTVYGGGEELCTRLDSRRLGAVFRFEGDTVSTIEVSFVRTEGM